MPPNCRDLRAALVWILALPAAAFAEQPTVTPVDVSAATTNCVPGVSGPVAAGAINFYFLPPEELRLVFDPAAACSTCTSGFQISKIHAVMQVAGPCSLSVSANLGSVAGGCPTPASVLCQGGVYPVVLPGAGQWDVGLPVACDCRGVHQKFTLGIEVFSLTNDMVVMTDGTPTHCTDWDSIGWGWVDLPATDSLWPGDLIFYADATCCVAVDAPSPIGEAETGLRIFPNPTLRSTTVSFALTSRSTVDLSVYDVGGRRVANLQRGPLDPGTFHFSWDGTDDHGERAPAGTYFVRLNVGDRGLTRKIVLVPR